MNTPKSEAPSRMDLYLDHIEGMFARSEDYDFEAWEAIKTACRMASPQQAHSAVNTAQPAGSVENKEAAMMYHPVAAEPELNAADAAYAERNNLVAALSKLYPAGVLKTAIEGWDEAWHNCIYIDLPTGQVSWHIHDREMAQFAHLPPYAGTWDGHDTPEKYRRLAALTQPVNTGPSAEPQPDWYWEPNEGRSHQEVWDALDDVGQGDILELQECSFLRTRYHVWFPPLEDATSDDERRFSFNTSEEAEKCVTDEKARKAALAPGADKGAKDNSEESAAA